MILPLGGLLIRSPNIVLPCFVCAGISIELDDLSRADGWPEEAPRVLRFAPSLSHVKLRRRPE